MIVFLAACPQGCNLPATNNLLTCVASIKLIPYIASSSKLQISTSVRDELQLAWNCNVDWTFHVSMWKILWIPKSTNYALSFDTLHDHIWWNEILHPLPHVWGALLPTQHNMAPVTICKGIHTHIPHFLTQFRDNWLSRFQVNTLRSKTSGRRTGRYRIESNKVLFTKAL